MRGTAATPVDNNSDKAVVHSDCADPSMQAVDPLSISPAASVCAAGVPSLSEILPS